MGSSRSWQEGGFGEDPPSPKLRRRRRDRPANNPARDPKRERFGSLLWFSFPPKRSAGSVAASSAGAELLQVSPGKNEAKSRRSFRELAGKARPLPTRVPEPPGSSEVPLSRCHASERRPT